MKILTHKFVEFIPNDLEDGILYVSMEYGTVVHKCCCGCGGKVVTPLTPTDWKLIYDGDTISLSPSIGNWSFDCKSHYFINNNKVEWAGSWPEEAIHANRVRDRQIKQKYYNKKDSENQYREVEKVGKSSLWSKIRTWWRNIW